MNDNIKYLYGAVLYRKPIPYIENNIPINSINDYDYLSFKLNPLKPDLHLFLRDYEIKNPIEKPHVLHYAQNQWSQVTKNQKGRPPSKHILLDLLDYLIQDPEQPLHPYLVALMLVHKMISRAVKNEYYDVLFVHSTEGLDHLFKRLSGEPFDHINLHVLISGVKDHWHSSGVHIVGSRGNLHCVFYDSSPDHKRMDLSNFKWLNAAISPYQNIILYRPPFDDFQRARRGCGVFAMNFLSDSSRLSPDALLTQMSPFECDSLGAFKKPLHKNAMRDLNAHFGKNIQNISELAKMSSFSPFVKRQGTTLLAYHRWEKDFQSVEKVKAGVIEQQVHNQSIPRKRKQFLIDLRKLVAASTDEQLENDLTKLSSLDDILQRQHSATKQQEWVDSLAARGLTVEQHCAKKVSGHP